jgi:hypothetical protein
MEIKEAHRVRRRLKEFLRDGLHHDEDDRQSTEANGVMPAERRCSVHPILEEPVIVLRPIYWPRKHV